MSDLMLFSGNCSAESAQGVRQQLRTSAAERIVPAGVRDDVALAATEFLANAFRAGAEHVNVAIRSRPTLLELRVTDDAPGYPHISPCSPQDTHGRGLSIIVAISENWGCQRHTSSKTVWARFRTAGAPPASVTKLQPAISGMAPRISPAIRIRKRATQAVAIAKIDPSHKAIAGSMTLREVAALFCVHQTTINRWVSEGALNRFPALGRERRFLTDDVQALYQVSLRSQKAKRAGDPAGR
jgi:excisionase family DNA binding protein